MTTRAAGTTVGCGFHACRRRIGYQVNIRAQLTGWLPVTDDRFDELTKTLGKTASRRTVVKGVLAAALGGLLARAGSDNAEAFRGRRGCGRVGQDCGGTNPGCCVGLTCGDDDLCCVADNQPCIEDSDCCAGDVCRPYGAFSYRCQAPGLVGEQCAEDLDCAGGIACTAGVCCNADGDTCVADADCCSGACDPYSGTCLLSTGVPCSDDAACASGVCDSYTGACSEGCLADGALCGNDFDCCSNACDPYTGTCLLDNGALCLVDEECASDFCDPYSGACLDFIPT